MSSTTAALHEWTIDEWYEAFADYEGGRCELVRGAAIMSPSEAGINSLAVMRLSDLLCAQLPPAWLRLTNSAIRIHDDPRPTVRIPDLIVVAERIDLTQWQHDPADVALVVEVVSPSSVERDLVTKRDEFAAAGVPNYLVVDVRGDVPEIYLFDTFVDGRYADPTGDGTQVTLRIDDQAITITAAELLA